MCPSNDLDNELTEIEYPLKSLKSRNGRKLAYRARQRNASRGVHIDAAVKAQ